VEDISSCQSNPVNTISAPVGNPLFHREDAADFAIQALEFSVHSLKAEPGGSYYFRTRMLQIVGGCGFVFQLDQMDSDEGRWFVAWSKFSTSHPKN